MNTNTMELNPNMMELSLDELEQVNGGGFFDALRKLAKKVADEVTDWFD